MNNNLMRELFQFFLPNENTYNFVIKNDSVKKKVAVVIASYDRYDDLLTVIDSALKINDVNIYVVNDGNNYFIESNGIKGICKEKGISLITKKKSMSLSHTRNVGFKIANADYIFSIDDDDYIHDSFIKWINKKEKLKYPVYRMPYILTSGKSKRPTWMGRAFLCLDKGWSYQASTYLLRLKNIREENILFPPVGSGNDRHVRPGIHKKIGVGKYVNCYGAVRNEENESIVRGIKNIQDVIDYFNFSEKFPYNDPVTTIHYISYRFTELGMFDNRRELVILLVNKTKEYGGFKTWLKSPLFLKFGFPLVKGKLSKEYKLIN